MAHRRDTARAEAHSGEGVRNVLRDNNVGDFFKINRILACVMDIVTANKVVENGV